MERIGWPALNRADRADAIVEHVGDRSGVHEIGYSVEQNLRGGRSVLVAGALVVYGGMIASRVSGSNP